MKIYNSRNFVWFYTFVRIAYFGFVIYNSRNFVWFYTLHPSLTSHLFNLQ